ncbi:MAG: hypothetical protein JWN03_7063 [Nocardia sp.]|uniref:CPBP family intramembrane glutamic endopeptidase n=1 Tax=Nocardia sp. TaxID=1821 RepID=UPI00262A797D|nr:CPBP family intramembrane glutamic endopeptidase [Nocardia sp.]MCU1646788.1 hypothetical protein [Nocardia sp.]
MFKDNPDRERWLLVGAYIGIVLPAMIGFGLTGAPILVVFAMPSVVALVLAGISRQRRNMLADFGIRRTSLTSLGAAIAAPAVAILIGVLLLVACGFDRVPQWLLPIGAWHVLSGIRQGMFEELGWRGFLQPQLNILLDARKAVVLTGLAWAIFHFGLILGDGIPGGAPWWLYLPIFTATLISVSVYAGYLRIITGSVWPAVALHASNNIVSSYVEQLLVSHSHPALAELLGDTTGLILWLSLAAWAWPRLRRIDHAAMQGSLR